MVTSAKDSLVCETLQRQPRARFRSVTQVYHYLSIELGRSIFHFAADLIKSLKDKSETVIKTPASVTFGTHAAFSVQSSPHLVTC